MTGKHREEEQTPLERAQFSKGEGKRVPTRVLPALKSPLARMGLEEPEELHLDMQQTVDEGKVMPKSECPVLKSPPAGTRLDKSGELYPVMKQTPVDGFSHADCSSSTDKGESFFFKQTSR